MVQHPLVAPTASRLMDGFRQAMRGYVGSVNVLTVEGESGRTGCVATSVSSFSMTPPCLIFSLAHGSSTARALRVGRPLGVNLLAPMQQATAACFAGATGVKGEHRFEEDGWVQAGNGAWVLSTALCGMACIIDEVWLRHAHLLVLARVDAVALRSTAPAVPLMYWSAGYRQADWR